ncbi:MAG TPA: hypothetical protein EYG60_00490 [Campylobacterales bacterium]|nr:hypothetical protein [Campylobacterales bacterium]
MKKIKIKINSRIFNLELEDDFADFLHSELQENLNRENNSIKDLLGAYINKNYELYEVTKRLQELNNKLS